MSRATAAGMDEALG